MTLMVSLLLAGAQGRVDRVLGLVRRLSGVQPHQHGIDQLSVAALLGDHGQEPGAEGGDVDLREPRPDRRDPEPQRPGGGTGSSG